MSALTSKQAEFKSALEDARAITHEAMCEAVALLPGHVRDRLAHGPHPRRWTCQVCDAFGADFYKGTPDLSDPLWVAWIYHEVPKFEMTRSQQLHYGESANDIYRRCLETYRAAGWTGVASEANA